LYRLGVLTDDVNSNAFARAIGVGVLKISGTMSDIRDKSDILDYESMPRVLVLEPIIGAYPARAPSCVGSTMK